MMRFYLVVAGAVAALGVACTNDCDDADDQARDKYKQCGVDLGSSDSDSTNTSTVVECTDELKVIRRAFAKCVKDASCDALTGKDQAGYTKYAACISGQ